MINLNKAKNLIEYQKQVARYESRIKEQKPFQRGIVPEVIKSQTIAN